MGMKLSKLSKLKLEFRSNGYVNIVENFTINRSFERGSETVDCINHNDSISNLNRKQLNIIIKELKKIETNLNLLMNSISIQLSGEYNVFIRGSEGQEDYKKEIYITISFMIFEQNNLKESNFIVFNDSINSYDHLYEQLLINMRWYNQNLLPISNFKENLNELLFEPKAAGIFFHECIGHFLESDYFYTSPIRFLYNNRLFSNSISITENTDGYIFDDCGSQIKNDLLLIKDGIILNTMNDNKTAFLYDYVKTGNGFSDSKKDGVIPRMNSMSVHGSLVSLNQVKKSITDGIFIKEVLLGEVNTFTGDFNVLVSKSNIIINGVLGSAIKQFNLFFNIRDLPNINLILAGNKKGFYNICVKNGVLKFLKYDVPYLYISRKKEVVDESVL